MKKTTPPAPPSLSPPPPLFLSLPNDVILYCLAHISRSYYPSLSLVSKRLQSLISSPDLYRMRSNIKNIENCLYVCLKLPTHTSLCWFNLLSNPNQTLINLKTNEKKSSGNVLVPIASSFYPNYSNSIVVVGSETYLIGGNSTKPSSTLQFYDKKNEIWRCHASSLKVARKDAIVGTLYEKIYVIGGCSEEEAMNWIEVFDVRTQLWESLMYPDLLRRYMIYQAKPIGEKLYVWTNGESYTYEPKQDLWEVVNWCLTRCKTSCVIENIVYYLDDFFGCIWHGPYGTEFGKSKIVKGLRKLNKFGRNYRSMSDMINYHGKLLILWDEFIQLNNLDNSDKKIWCTLISLEKRKNGSEIWGNIEWTDDVLVVPNSFKFVRSLCKKI